MKTKLTKTFLLLTALAGITLFSSCDHKDLIYGSEPTPVKKRTKTRVVYDWRNAPDANPASMELCLYPAGSNSHLSYNLSGKDGGYITLASGAYDAISMNNDDLDWALYRNTNDEDDFEVYTHDASELGAYKLLTSSIPRAGGTEMERIAATPEMSWGTRADNFEISQENDENVITLYPEEIVCHYTVTIRNVENILSARGEEIDGTLSGMAEGYRHGSSITTDTPVTMPFQLTIDTENKTLHGEFLTFGECCTTDAKHILTIYLFLTDGTKWYYTFDVHDQVANATDPKHVDIVVEGLDLPKPLTGGGLIPDVNDWNTEVVDLKM